MLAGCERSLEPPRNRRDLVLEHPPIGELQQTDAAIVRAGDHRADRRLDPGHPDAVGGLSATRRLAERLPECIAESAVGLVSGVEHGVVQIASVANPFEGAREPARAAV